MQRICKLWNIHHYSLVLQSAAIFFELIEELKNGQ